MTQDLREQLQKTLGSTYALERELGGGGMSRVFVAEETSLGRKVVVKVLPPDLAATVNVERFRREIQLAAQLQHPHIVPLLSAGIADGLPYYTMPLVEGDSLRMRLIRHGELPIQDAIKILRDVASALEYAHERGVVHRDIKPENVLVTKHHAAVTDFGVAKALSASTNPGSSLTSLGVALGTPAYMAPEQATADPTTDHRADIYALGALAYEMLTGRQVFGDRSPQAMLRAHAVEQPAPIESHRPTVPAPLAALVMRMLEKHPADRPQSAEDVLRTLDTFVVTPTGGMTPTGMTPTASVPVPARQITRSRPLIAAALVGAGVLAAAGMYARSRAAGPSLDPLRVVVPAFANNTGEARFDALGPLAADWLTRGLTQADIADVALVDSVSGPGRTTVIKLSDAELRTRARLIGAGRLVRGSIVRNGDSLQFQAVVVDVKTGNMIANVQPSSAPVATPMAGIDGMRQRAMGALATLSRRKVTGLAVSDVPPSYEAYQAFMQGEEEFQRYRYVAAITHYARAAALDPSYAAPLVRAAYAYRNSNDCSGTDSLARLLQGGSPPMSEYESRYLDRVIAWCQGNWNAAYRAAQQFRALAPTSSFTAYVSGEAAINLNRLREARTKLEQLWPNKYPSIFYYANLSMVYHLLGDAKRERRVVETGRAMFPDLLQSLAVEGRYHAGRGDVAQVERVIQELRARHRPPDDNANVPISTLISELATHGELPDARRLADEWVAWLLRRPGVEKRQSWHARALSVALIVADRCPEATRLADSALRADTAIAALGIRGRVAARCGDSVAADSIDAALADLDRPYLRGEHTLFRALMAAARGGKREAVDLLVDAIAQGVSYVGHFHGSYDFAPLRDYPPFEALLEPKG